MRSVATSRYSFQAYLRTGRLVTADGVEHKYNHNHDPENGRFTFAAGGDSGTGTSRGDRGVGDEDGNPTPSTNFKRTALRPDDYNEQATSLWGDMEGSTQTGFSNDDAVRHAVQQRSATAAREQASGTLPVTVEAPEDVRRAVASIAKRTAAARLRGDQKYEKTLTFERGSDGQVVITSLGLSGRQGGRLRGLTSSTVAIAHVHYTGLDQSPFGLDYTGARAGIPSFVIGGDRGEVWEVGRQDGKDVQRVVRADGTVGRWTRFGR